MWRLSTGDYPLDLQALIRQSYKARTYIFEYGFSLSALNPSIAYRKLEKNARNSLKLKEKQWIFHNHIYHFISPQRIISFILLMYFFLQNLCVYKMAEK